MPRRPPTPLPWLACARWPSTEAYWAAPVVCPDLAAKYEGLLALIDEPAGARRDARARELALRWPGALREAQWVPRSILSARASAAANIGTCPRGVWAAAGQAALVLWADLHPLLADLRAMRPAEDPWRGFARLDAEARGRWPSAPPTDPEQARRWSEVRIDARLPRAWLAAVAGLDPAALDAALRR